jgi:hypothetical protein
VTLRPSCKQLLDIAIAEREPKIEPDRVLNHGRREAMAAVREQRHAPTIRLSALPASVSVTMPTRATRVLRRSDAELPLSRRFGSETA